MFFGAWVAGRGAFFYEWDPVLLGTGGGIALGGLLITVLTIGAYAQIATARDTAAMRAAFERGMPRSVAPAGPMPGPPKLRALAQSDVNVTSSTRTEPKLSSTV